MNLTAESGWGRQVPQCPRVLSDRSARDCRMRREKGGGVACGLLLFLAVENVVLVLRLVVGNFVHVRLEVVHFKIDFLLEALKYVSSELDPVFVKPEQYIRKLPDPIYELKKLELPLTVIDREPFLVRGLERRALKRGREMIRGWLQSLEAIQQGRKEPVAHHKT